MEHCCIKSERDCLPPQQVRLSAAHKKREKRWEGNSIQRSPHRRKRSVPQRNGQRGGFKWTHTHTQLLEHVICADVPPSLTDGGETGPPFQLNQGGRWRPSQLAADLKVADVHSYFPPPQPPYLPALFLQTQKKTKEKEERQPTVGTPPFLRCSRTQFSHRLSHRPTPHRLISCFNVIKSFCSSRSGNSRLRSPGQFLDCLIFVLKWPRHHKKKNSLEKFASRDVHGVLTT